MAFRHQAIATVALVAMTAAGAPALAQPLGTFSWQLQPYCNRVTFAVTQNGGAFALDGFDDQCGGAVRAAAAGVATINSNGSIAIGFSISTSDGAQHLSVQLDLSTLSGTWRDSNLDTGTFAFNGSAPGGPRPSVLAYQHQAAGYHATTTFGGGFFFGRGRNGTAAAPTATTLGDSLTRFGAGGYNGSAYNWPTGMVSMVAAEDWTPTANGTRLQFWTTANGATSPTVSMMIDYTGFVGIGTGTARPFDRLQVGGDIRVGTAGTNGCLKDAGGGAIVGTCASDARFKRDVVGYADALMSVAALRPVTFSWNAEAFPDRGFGPARQFGLIAQEVEQIFPELVETAADGYKAVNYGALPLLAIQAVKELKARYDALERRLATLEATRE